MGVRGRYLVLVGAIAAAVMGASRVNAQMCFPAEVEVRLPGGRIPQNGAVLIQVWCEYDDQCRTMSPPVVSAVSAGDTVLGAVRDLAGQSFFGDYDTPSFLGYYSWTPDQKLLVGSTLQVSVAVSGRLFDATEVSRDVLIDEARALEDVLRDASVSLIVNGFAEYGDFYCFKDLPPTDCYMERSVSKQFSLHPYLQVGCLPEADSFLFRLESEEPHFGFRDEKLWGLASPAEEPAVDGILFSTIQERYCVTLEALRITDGTIFRRDLCATEVDPDRYGIVDVSPDYALEVCTAIANDEDGGIWWDFPDAGSDSVATFEPPDAGRPVACSGGRSLLDAGLDAGPPTVPDATTPQGDAMPDAGTGGIEESDGCGCRAAGSNERQGTPVWTLLLLAAFLRRVRRGIVRRSRL